MCGWGQECSLWGSCHMRAQAGGIARRLVSSSLVCVLDDVLQWVWGRLCRGRSALESAGCSCTLVLAGVHTSGSRAHREESPWDGEHLWSELQSDSQPGCCRPRAAPAPRAGCPLAAPGPESAGHHLQRHRGLRCPQSTVRRRRELGPGCGERPAVAPWSHWFVSGGERIVFWFKCLFLI